MLSVESVRGWRIAPREVRQSETTASGTTIFDHRERGIGNRVLHQEIGQIPGRRKVSLQTDHKTLSYLRSTNFSNHRITRWALLLQNYSFDVVHIKGENNLLADLCSRLV